MADHPETTALRLAEAATPGPWVPQVCYRNDVEVLTGAVVADRSPSHEWPTVARATWRSVLDPQAAANAAHIAHAHPGRVRAWLGAVARLRLIVAQGHMSWCKGKGAFGGGGACTCGHEDDLAALAAVDAEG